MTFGPSSFCLFCLSEWAQAPVLSAGMGATQYSHGVPLPCELGGEWRLFSLGARKGEQVTPLLLAAVLQALSVPGRTSDTGCWNCDRVRPTQCHFAALPETPVPFAAKSEGRARGGPGEAGASDGFRRMSALSESAHLYLNSNFLFLLWG